MRLSGFAALRKVMVIRREKTNLPRHGEITSLPNTNVRLVEEEFEDRLTGCGLSKLLISAATNQHVFAIRSAAERLRRNPTASRPPGILKLCTGADPSED